MATVLASPPIRVRPTTPSSRPERPSPEQQGRCRRDLEPSRERFHRGQNDAPLSLPPPPTDMGCLTDGPGVPYRPTRCALSTEAGESSLPGVSPTIQTDLTRRGVWAARGLRRALRSHHTASCSIRCRRGARCLRAERSCALPEMASATAPHIVARVVCLPSRDLALRGGQHNPDGQPGRTPALLLRLLDLLDSHLLGPRRSELVSSTAGPRSIDRTTDGHPWTTYVPGDIARVPWVGGVSCRAQRAARREQVKQGVGVGGASGASSPGLRRTSYGDSVGR